MINDKKIAVIGLGSVGSTIAYSLIQEDIFNEVVLVDVNYKRAEGEALDMIQSSLFTSPFNIHAGDYSSIKDAKMVIIAAGPRQDPTQSRLSQIKAGVEILDNIIDQLNNIQYKGFVILVINPVDVLTYRACKKLRYVSRHKIIGTGTLLDTIRLKNTLARELKVNAKNIDATIIGEHGPSQVPLFSKVRVSSLSIEEYAKNNRIHLDKDFYSRVKKEVAYSGYDILEKKGPTCYGIAKTTLKLVKAIDQDENVILPVSTYVSGEYGLTDLAISLPCKINKTGIKKIVDLNLTKEEKDSLLSSSSALKKVILENNI